MHLAMKPLCDTPSVAASHFRSCLSPIPMCFWFIQYSTNRNCDEFGPIFRDLASRTMACNYFLGLFFRRDLLNSTIIMQAGMWLCFKNHETYGRVSRTVQNRVAF